MTDSLNVCVGIDAGSSESKLAYADNLSTRIIAVLDGLDLNAIREEAEAFFDEPVFACVAAVPENFTRAQRDDLRIRAGSSGFGKIEIIPEHEAVILGLGGSGRTLVYDLGASACRMFMLDGAELIESVTVGDVCGREFDRKLSEYLAERFRIEAVDVNDVRRIKHALSEENYAVWRETRILRDELERLLHFPVKRTGRILSRLERVHNPDRIILTGGSIKVPCVWKVLTGSVSVKPEYRGNIIAEGAASRAMTLQNGSREARKADNSAKIRELRAAIISIEELLTRRQKDRVYAIFRQAEGINDSTVLAMMENLIREIKNA
ncbi:MAG: Hsp70 family protein [Synergistaceae bacterium]|nr:Hsp70 family protein [Synergistaceae bacterium]